MYGYIPTSTPFKKCYQYYNDKAVSALIETKTPNSLVRLMITINSIVMGN